MQKLAKIITIITLAVTITLASISMPVKSYAAAADYQKAQISFTFDDGFESAFLNAAPTLQARGMTATMYIITSLENGLIWSGKTDDNKAVMTWPQVHTLHDTYGWEIGSHTQTHTEMPTLTAAQQITELQKSKTDLEAQGFTNVTTIATPYGAYDNTTLIESLKDYAAHRGFADRDALNVFPYSNRAVIMVQSLDNTMTLAQAKTFVDQAIANKQYLVFVGHSIENTVAANGYEYTWKTSDLAALADYVKAKTVQVVNLQDGLKLPGTVIDSNTSFENNMANWSTDNATDIVVDTARNGSYPSPQNSIKLTGSATGSHLFSDLISVIPGKDYLIDAFYNALGLTSGEFGFYMDEYDTNNNWISGQWLGMVTNGTIGFFDKIIQTTSTLISKFRVQTYLTPNAVGTVYTDNINLYDMTATPSASITPTITPTPTGTPSATPTPVQGQNLVQNSGFESVTSGFADSWTKDTTAWTIDSASTGNEGVNSAKVVMNTASNHLFSSLISVTPGTTYTWNSFVKATNLTSGEFGFYIDEYDDLGNWISGQWKGMVNAAFEGIKTIAYIPTNALVNVVRLQYYTTAGTGTVNVDSVGFIPPVTPTSVPSTTPTGTPSITPTVSPTGTPSATPSDTPTGTPSVTPTDTPSITPTETPTGTPSATPTPTVSISPTVTPTPGINLILNPSFEQLDASNWATSWTRETTDWLVDTTSLGSDGTNSVKLALNGLGNHLFSTLITINNTSTYLWSQYIKTTDLTGEFGFYIDEYDAAGTWISGQWKGMINASFTGLKQFNYLPSSANVKTIRLQYYVSPSSTGNIIIDADSLTTK